MSAETTSALNSRDVTRDIFSASIGSVACCYTGQPFDTVKVRMQTNPTAFPSVAFTTKSIMTNEGASALWKGAVPTSLGMVAENAMAFGVNEALKRTFPDDAKEDPTKRPDLVKPFLMVCPSHHYCFGIILYYVVLYDVYLYLMLCICLYLSLILYYSGFDYRVL